MAKGIDESWVNDVTWAQDRDGDKYLSRHRDISGGGSHGIDDPVSLDELASFLDDELEHGNYHSFVGFFEYLSKVMKEKVGNAMALAIMHTIAREDRYPK